MVVWSSLEECSARIGVSYSLMGCPLVIMEEGTDSITISHDTGATILTLPPTACPVLIPNFLNGEGFATGVTRK